MENNLVTYTVYNFDNGAYHERHKFTCELIKESEIEEMLMCHNAHVITGDNGDHISSYKINGKWFSLLINSSNTLDNQLREICESMKCDITVLTISNSKYNYRYSTLTTRAV